MTSVRYPSAHRRRSVDDPSVICTPKPGGAVAPPVGTGLVFLGLFAASLAGQRFVPAT